MELEVSLLERVRTYESSSRWEKSELGRDLRRSGLSYGEIMDLIPVKKSTLATWCREVRLTVAQVQAIKDRRAQEPGLPRDTQRKRRLEIAEIRRQATAQVSTLIADPLWIAGIALYWAERSKTRNQLRLANTDPDALRLFVSWVRRFIDETAGFSIQLHLHEGNDEVAARETGVVQQALMRPITTRRTSSREAPVIARTTSRSASAQSRFVAALTAGSGRWPGSECFPRTWALMSPTSTLSASGRWRNWQRNGLLTRRFWVRIPGDPPHDLEVPGSSPGRPTEPLPGRRLHL